MIRSQRVKSGIHFLVQPLSIENTNKLDPELFSAMVSKLPLAFLRNRFMPRFFFLGKGGKRGALDHNDRSVPSLLDSGLF